MPTVRPRRFSPQFKLKVMERIRCGEVPSAVAEELGVEFLEFRDTTSIAE
jgi:transposase-like protein